MSKQQPKPIMRKFTVTLNKQLCNAIRVQAAKMEMTMGQLIEFVMGEYLAGPPAQRERK